jgi:hypothetical protein
VAKDYNSTSKTEILYNIIDIMNLFELLILILKISLMFAKIVIKLMRRRTELVELNRLINLNNC